MNVRTVWSTLNRIYNFNYLFALFVTLALFVHPACSSAWLTLASVGTQSIDTSAHCSHGYGLSTPQTRFCKRNSEQMINVIIGAEMAIIQCRHQLADRKWNCTTTLNHRHEMFKKIMDLDSKETAFINALSASALATAVTEMCSNMGHNQFGHMAQYCGCDRSVDNEDPEMFMVEKSNQINQVQTTFQWGGCSDNVKFGVNFARRFVELSDRDNIDDIDRVMANYHNNEVGLQAFMGKSYKKCKCHGVSGACSLQTCVIQKPPYSDLSAHLKRRYDRAVHVKLKSGAHDYSEPVIVKVDDEKVTPSIEDLAFLKESPDFCNESHEYGFAGTRGRVCNPHHRNEGSCRQLCCGRGFQWRQKTTMQQCKCQFVYCCQVNCETCPNTTRFGVCN